MRLQSAEGRPLFVGFVALRVDRETRHRQDGPAVGKELPSDHSDGRERRVDWREGCNLSFRGGAALDPPRRGDEGSGAGHRTHRRCADRLVYVALGTYVSHGLREIAEDLFDEMHRKQHVQARPGWATDLRTGGAL